MSRYLQDEARAVAVSMVRLENGCEKGHRGGQWHIHEEPFHALGRRLAFALSPDPAHRESGERLARLIEEADATNPEWARGARFVLGWPKGPDDSALEIAFNRVRDAVTLTPARTPTWTGVDQ